MSSNRPAIGIDLGTTFCCVAYMNPTNKQVKIIKNKNGSRITPSYIQFTKKEEIVGDYAKKKVPRDQKNVVYDSKRLIGQNFDNKDIQRNIKHNWSFEVVRGTNNTPCFKIPCHKKTYTPQDISAKLLNYMKTIAEDDLGASVTDAVITVPAYFNYHQRTATMEAGKLAGLNVLNIMNEPTAAIFAYMHDTTISMIENILVFDLGGGTFDVSIAMVENKTMTVKATAGNTHLGGRDFDNNLANFVKTKLGLDNLNISDTNKQLILRRIHAKSESIKKVLTDQLEAHFELDSLIADEDVDILITKDDFELLNIHLFQQCIDITNGCIEDAGLTKADINRIILIGGSTRIPKLQDMIKKLFGGKELTKYIDQDEAVAYGAAIHATQFKVQDVSAVVQQFSDVTSLSLGTDVVGGIMSVLIPRNSPLPVTNTKTYITNTDKQTAMWLNIFEGERSLVQCNNKIGKSIIRLPPRPPGYSVEVTFHVNANGILHIYAKTFEGIHTQLKIEYEKNDLQTVMEMIQDAKVNQSKDHKISNGISKWNELLDYCTKMKTVCTYNKHKLNDASKCRIESICDDSILWLKRNPIRNGSQQEKDAIFRKRKEVVEICEPIAVKFGFSNIISMNWSQFYDFINE